MCRAGSDGGVPFKVDVHSPNHTRGGHRRGEGLERLGVDSGTLRFPYAFLASPVRGPAVAIAMHAVRDGPRVSEQYKPTMKSKV